MGNCANKPLTTEGETPAPETKTTMEEREIPEVADENKVTGADDHTKSPSLAQMLELQEEAKPKGDVAAKPAVEKSSQPEKGEVPQEVAVETQYQAPKPVAEPPKPEVSEPKKDEPKPAVVPAVAPATTDKKVEDKKPEAK